MSSLSLDAPTQVTLPGHAPAIAHVAKSGPDLTVSFTDGQDLSLQNFFVPGAQGDFSSLAAADGSTVLSGMTAPEPLPEDIQTAPDATGTGTVMGASEYTGPEHSQDVSYTADGVGETDSGGWGGVGTLGTAGLGVSAGLLGLGLFAASDASGNDDDGGDMTGLTASRLIADDEVDSLLSSLAEPENADDIETLIAETAGSETGATDDTPTDVAPEAIDTGADAPASDGFLSDTLAALPDTAGDLLSALVGEGE